MCVDKQIQSLVPSVVSIASINVGKFLGLQDLEVRFLFLDWELWKWAERVRALKEQQKIKVYISGWWRARNFEIRLFNERQQPNRNVSLLFLFCIANASLRTSVILVVGVSLNKAVNAEEAQSRKINRVAEGLFTKPKLTFTCLNGIFEKNVF